ncbi:MAG TPA: glycoside hydrolase family 38 C-terminal domain-containing protein [Gaiellales bacterium]|nr:glycoside hydrolase family 38 C-terminal domain-containing protein [Gaiellales bacterium]
MIRHSEYTRARIAQVGERIEALVYPDRRAPERLAVAGPVGHIAVSEAEGLEYRDAALGEQFGPAWSTFWFAVEATVPPGWEGERVDLLFVSHSEATLWMNGRSVQGLNTSRHGPRPDAVLRERAAAGERIEARIELACNGKFGRLEPVYETVEPVVLDRCQIARFDPQAWRLHHDFDVLRRLEADAGNGLDPTWAGELRRELNRVCNVFREDDRATWEASSAILETLLSRRNATVVHELSAIGHAHIDTIWLWPLAETHRKLVRTFSSQTTYMERYPEFRFCCSQAYQYDWVRRHAPDLYARIRDRVGTGQWVPVGGTWIEPDCNLPSGESLVRQFLVGQRYFARELAGRHRVFWNPDVFGYNGQLPQIMRGAGIDRFLTQKLSWNRFNPPPHHTFDWEGIDGSRVLAHFPPADTYNAEAEIAEMRRNARDYRGHAFSRRSLLVFGYGDGGGGPTPAMLETLRRTRDLQGVPRTTIATPDEFFDALAADAADRPVLVGELYFEYHRGTYTTQAAAKRANRECERALHDAELLAAVAGRVAGGGYPREALAEAWELLLLNQFHDVLPGSSIGEVYEQTARDHARVAEICAAASGEALGRLTGEGQGATPVNTLGVCRAEVAHHPEAGLVWVMAPPCGAGAVGTAPGAVRVAESGDEIVLENDRLRATIGRDGLLRSLVEIPSGREALADPGNRLQLFDDRPVANDAWDVDPFHLETEAEIPPAESVAVVRSEALRAEVEIRWRFGRASAMCQTVRLDAGSPRLEFHCEADWRERHTLLKVLFPVAVRAANATYQMQFGHTERPTHYTTSHDEARFEVPGHRFCDLSEHGFGVALLTDCKYGYSTYENRMRISLLRSPTYPDPEADQGAHRFAYAVMPHAAGWRSAGVVAEAARFEAPLRWGWEVTEGSWFAVDTPNLVLDTVKRAEDSDAIVLRLYEAHGARGRARIRVGLPFSEAARANLLEDAGDGLSVAGDTIEVDYRPHEIVTVLVR